MAKKTKLRFLKRRSRSFAEKTISENYLSSVLSSEKTLALTVTWIYLLNLNQDRKWDS